MSLANLIGNTTFVSVEHLKVDQGSTTKLGFVSDAGLAAVPVNIQPANAEVLAVAGGAYGKTFTVFTTASGILETDRLTTVSGSSTRKFIVKGKLSFDYGYSQHYELLVEEPNE